MSIDINVLMYIVGIVLSLIASLLQERTFGKVAFILLAATNLVWLINYLQCFIKKGDK